MKESSSLWLRKKSVLFIPNILEDIFGDTTLMSNALRPNGAGYRIIVDRIGCSLTQVIQQNATSFRMRSGVSLG
ncbi:MAG: hypothetical protein GY941_09965 [Planctomycetes bacterium]|nr:hypothetical protein [Planctomycetota bacterium]